jgi:transposase-like protein
MPFCFFVSASAGSFLFKGVVRYFKRLCYNCIVTTTKGGITVDWNTLKAEYIAGGISYRELAEKYGVSQSTLRQRAAREKWSEQKNTVRTEVEQKMIDTISDEQTEQAVSAASLISKAAMNFLKQIAAESVKLINGEIDSESRTKYSEYALALQRFKDVLDIKSEKDIEEQQARIDNLRKQAQKDEKKDNKIIVEFGEFEDWAK